MWNPRFPHTLQVLRAAVDSKGDIVTDAQGDPTWNVVPLSVVEYLNDEPVRSADGGFVASDCNTVNFGYRTSTGGLRTSGEVIVADFKIATPMILTEVKTGDRVQCTDYQRTFMAKVLKCTTYNLGTNLWIDEIKN